jgi:hypothetical protein
MTNGTSEVAGTIGVRMYGVSLNLHCDLPDLGEYVAGLLPGISGPPCAVPDLEVNARWVVGPWDRGSSLFPDSGALDGLGKRMWIGDDELVWFETHRDRDLQLRFRRDGGKVVFDVAYCYQPSERKQAKYPDFRQKKFFDLARYLVYFPIAWHLERTRGWALIHASAVARDDRAVLIVGPGGAGKTTTSVALVARTGMSLVTENLLFCDGARIYPLIEPLRLTGPSLALLSEELAGLQPIAVPGGLQDKSMFWLRAEPTLKDVTATAIFMPQFSRTGFVAPVAADIACERIGAINRLTLELNDYYWYTAALDLLWPQGHNAQRQLDVLRTLTAITPCYTLGIDRSAGTAAVVDQVLQCIGASNGAHHGQADS